MESFVTRVAACVAVFGSLVALGSVAIGSAVGVLRQNQVGQTDDVLRAQFSQRDLFTSVEQRIAEQEKLIKQLKSPEAKREEERNLAALYEELGNRSVSFNQLPRAEEAFLKSRTLDPDNPRYLTDLATLYAAAAVRQAESRQRVSLLRNSSQLFADAASVVSDPGMQAEYRNGAANALIGVASEFSRAGQAMKAIRELNLARDLAVDGSTVEAKIDQMLNQVGNGE
jgi:tetratricopeptide (TPR) repeat protein